VKRIDNEQLTIDSYAGLNFRLLKSCIPAHLEISVSMVCRTLVVVLVAFFHLSLFSNAQQALLLLEEDTIQIGEPTQLRLRLSFSKEVGDEVYWPQFSDTLNRHIEVLERSNVDTIQSISIYDFTIEQQITITSWDSGFWAIAPFEFLLGFDTISTDFVFLEVGAPAVDTAAEFKDIKDIYEIKLTFWEWVKKFWYWFVIALAGLCLIIFLVVKMFPKKKNPAHGQQIEVRILPYELAMKKLELVRSESLWQNGNVKEYHSRLSDILREYIESKYRVPAREEITTNILGGLAAKPVSQHQLSELENILRLADMVKFAKQNPDATANENSYSAAKLFLLETHQDDKVIL